MATSTTEQDFFQIKENLKTYLRSQSEFEDYDFDGSAMTTLLDVMAFNTHYSAITANMSVNEMFLDTAQVRNNVISHAKGLGYTTQSPRSAFFLCTITADSSATSEVTIPRGSTFTTTGSKPFTFTTLSDFSSMPSGGIITFTNVIAYEGKMLKNTYTVGSEEQRYEIPNKFCDTSSLRVEVRENSSTSDKKIYKLGKYLTDTLITSEVYFLQEGFDEKYEVYFGDNIIGKKLSVDNVITIEYLKTSGSLGNSIQQFTFSSTVTGLTNITIATTSASSGGANIESISSIKKNAPFNYSAQNRAVTAEDYKTIIKKIYPNIDAIAVWGGEDNDPPIYGKVFASVKPNSGAELTEAVKSIIERGLARYKVMSIIPEVVSPDYIYLKLDVSFTFNPTVTNYTSAELTTKVQEKITEYNTELSEFNKIFHNSVLACKIDSADASITASTVKHIAKKYLTIPVDTTTKYEFSINNSIYNPHSGHEVPVVYTNKFYITGDVTNLYHIEDDGIGKLGLYVWTPNAIEKSLKDANFGTVDYLLGKIVVNALKVGSFTGTDKLLQFNIDLTSYDVLPVRNLIIQIESSEINSIEDNPQSGSYNGNINYTPASARI